MTRPFLFTSTAPLLRLRILKSVRHYSNSSSILTQMFYRHLKLNVTRKALFIY